MAWLIALALGVIALLGIADNRRALIVVAALLPTYLIRFIAGGFPTTFLEAAVILIAFTTTVRPSGRRSLAAAWYRLPAPVLVLSLLFLVACMVSVIGSDQPVVSLGIFKGWILTPMVFAWLSFAFAEDKKTQQAVVSSLLLSGSVMALLGISQIGTLVRSQGIYDVPASLALFIAPLAAIAAWQAVYPSTHRRAWLAVILVAGVLATQALGAIIALGISLFIGSLLWLPTRRKKRLVLWLTLGIVMSAIILASTGRLSYFSQGFKPEAPPTSVAVRLQLWSVSRDLIKQAPILGIGLGQFEPAYQKALHERFARYSQCTKEQSNSSACLPAPLPEFVFRDPHNWFLSLWLNVGILGLLSFVALHFWVIRATVHSAVNKQPAVQGLLLALMTLGAYGLTDTIYWKNDLATLQWLLLSIILLYVTQPSMATKPD